MQTLIIVFSVLLVATGKAQDGVNGGILIKPQYFKYEGACPVEIGFAAEGAGPSKKICFYWERNDGKRTQMSCVDTPNGSFQFEDRISVPARTGAILVSDTFNYRFSKREKFSKLGPVNTEVVCRPQQP